ncbi:MAG: sugar phosphate nucleotidyltransferase [Collinsella intestinalis]
MNAVRSPIPFMGHYRLIDFPLSNMMNAGIRTVGVVLPGNYRSLVDHLGSGREWELDRKKGGLFLLQGSAYGTAKKGIRFLLRDINTNKILVQRASEPYVVMSATNIVFNMDLSAVIDAHERSGSGVTMIYKKADRQLEDVTKLDINENGRVTDLKSGCAYGDNQFLDCFIINRDLLLELCEQYETLDYLDLFDAIRPDFGRIDVCTYEFKGLVGMFNERAITSGHGNAQPRRHAQLFAQPPDHDQARHAARSTARSNATNSFISAGCRIDGTVRGSTLSRDVIESSAYVASSIIMQLCHQARRARRERHRGQEQRRGSRDRPHRYARQRARGAQGRDRVGPHAPTRQAHQARI